MVAGFVACVVLRPTPSSHVPGVEAGVPKEPRMEIRRARPGISLMPHRARADGILNAGFVAVFPVKIAETAPGAVTSAPEDGMQYRHSLFEYRLVIGGCSRGQRA